MSQSTQKALAEIPKREQRSISEVTREIVVAEIERHQKQHAADIQIRLLALDRARQVRRSILEDRAGETLSRNISGTIEELRKERDDHIPDPGN